VILPSRCWIEASAGERRALWDHQVKTLLGFLAVVIAGLTPWFTLSGQYGNDRAS